ncbi:MULTISPECIES: TRAP transporter large permease [Pacificibacter]|uniref:TRAP transporter large permease n=1 Tax=Pacificibacter TaxID=1042323 RepID=UPI001C081787|nr:MULTISPECIES: TRAP transporter large permease [Pacificibacter]MBU2936416.1 TRAP transporter large permease [Pacificibacter marinus]MDO6616543.1 TRAP transporter large permease [Pacificibacter sp. 1_MG-2023]
MTEILFLALFALLLMGVPVAFSLGIASVAALYFGSSIPMLIVPQKLFNGLNSFPFLAIPLFLLAGNIMAAAQISERLVKLSGLALGRYPGGLAQMSTGASAFFGAISGSAPATTSAIGSILIPSMVKRGYAPAFAGAVVASSGALGLIIPPSLTMVIYGTIADVSIGDLFIAGILPGIVIACALGVVNYIMAKRLGLSGEPVSPDMRPRKVIAESSLALVMPLIILGGIYGGIFTPTESAAVACLYGLIVGMFVYRSISFKSLGPIFIDTAISSAIVMYLMGTANAFSYIITAEQVPQALAASILEFSSNPTLIMVMILALLLLAGTFLDNVAALVLLVPTLGTLILAVGIDPIYFGVFTVIALAVGNFTPPVGLNLFIAARLSKSRMEDISKSALPYIGAYLVVLILLILFPKVITLFV